MPDIDVLFVGDFRFPGGTSAAMAHEIRTLSGAGHSVGLVHLRSALLGRDRVWHRDLKHHVAAGNAVLIDDGDDVSCKLLIVHHPQILMDRPEIRCKAQADQRLIVAHHPPCDSLGRLYYDPWSVDRIASECFGGGFIWAPISPVCRASFSQAGVDLALLEDDWTNVIFVDDWGGARPSPRFAERPAIGRHSRPGLCKWPATRAELLEVCPDDPAIDVRLLGVGKSLRRLIDPVPANWTTFDFNEIDPKDFLRSIDFFVYYHHPTWVEAFGRTIAEAAASGAVVIVPPYFQRTFGDAAVYRKPEQAIETVFDYFEHGDKFGAQSLRGREVIDRLYGPQRYLRRIGMLLDLAEHRKSPGSVMAEYQACGRRPVAVYWRRLEFRVGRLFRRSFKAARRLIKRPARYLGAAIQKGLR